MVYLASSNLGRKQGYMVILCLKKTRENKKLCARYRIIGRQTAVIIMEVVALRRHFIFSTGIFSVPIRCLGIFI